MLYGWSPKILEVIVVSHLQTLPPQEEDTPHRFLWKHFCSMLSFSTSCSRMFALWFTSISWCTKQGDAFVLLSTRPRSLCLHSNRILPLRASPSEENNETNEDQEPIPQLPAIGCSSFEPTSSDDYCNNDLKDGKKIAYIGGKFEMQYTCKICETRNSNRVSRLGKRGLSKLLFLWLMSLIPVDKDLGKPKYWHPLFIFAQKLIGQV